MFAFPIEVGKNDNITAVLSAQQQLKKKFAKKERDELRDLEKLDTPKWLVPRTKHTSHVNKKQKVPVVEEYVGLWTHSIYTKKTKADDSTPQNENDSNSDEDAASSDSGEKQDDLDPLDDLDDNEEPKKLSTAPVSRSYDIYTHGLEELPRAASPVRVIRDNPATTALLNKQSGLSKKAIQVVGRNSIREYGGSLRLEDNSEVSTADSRTTSLRLRHIDLINTMVHLAMLRGDYALASRGFALLIRVPRVNIRLIWTIGLELLVWRRERREAGIPTAHNSEILPYGEYSNTDPHTSIYQKGKKTEDEEFLQWLVINYPYSPRGHEVRDKVRADIYNAYLVLSKLRHFDPKAALDRLEELMLEPPYSERSIYYVLAGIATIQLACLEKAKKLPDKRILEGYAKKSEVYFQHCIKYGGVYPEDMVNSEIQSMVHLQDIEPNVLDNDDATSTSDDSMAIDGPQNHELEVEFSD